MSNEGNVINYAKDDYDKPQLILGTKMGLIDTTNLHYPKIWNLYLRQKELDWTHDEFDMSSCLRDFERSPKHVVDKLYKTISYQWHGDTTASRNLAPLLAPFISNTELWTAIMKVGEIECLHGIVYSEIVRNSFKDPSRVLKEMAEMEAVHDRLKIIIDALEEGYTLSHDFAMGRVSNTQDTFNKVVMLFLAFYCLERIMFMASFAVTFAICELGVFTGIGLNVKKIAQDELEIHAVLMREVLTELFATPQGKIAKEQLATKMRDMVDEVISTEYDWIDNYLYDDGIDLVGLPPKRLKDWTLFSSMEVFDTIGMESAIHDRMDNNPLPFMTSWLNPSIIQTAAQEKEISNYKLNMLKRTDEGQVYDVDF